jgi:hypothetical protein
MYLQWMQCTCTTDVGVKQLHVLTPTCGSIMYLDTGTLVLVHVLTRNAVLLYS